MHLKTKRGEKRNITLWWKFALFWHLTLRSKKNNFKQKKKSTSSLYQVHYYPSYLSKGKYKAVRVIGLKWINKFNKNPATFNRAEGFEWRCSESAGGVTGFWVDLREGLKWGKSEWMLNGNWSDGGTGSFSFCLAGDLHRTSGNTSACLSLERPSSCE